MSDKLETPKVKVKRRRCCAVYATGKCCKRPAELGNSYCTPHAVVMGAWDSWMQRLCDRGEVVDMGEQARTTERPAGPH